MMRKNLLFGPALVLALLCSSALYAQKKPVRNVSGKRHPNLAAAQQHCSMAFQKITAAQEANEFDMDGHAAKAKDLLEQADKELKAAAEAANKNKEK